MVAHLEVKLFVGERIYMKRNWIVIILSFLLLVPSYGYALTVDHVSLSNPGEVKPADEFEVTINASLSDAESGFVGMNYQLHYDTNLLTFAGVTVNSDKEWEIEEEVKDGVTSIETAMTFDDSFFRNGYTNAEAVDSSYSATLRFYVKNVASQNATVRVSNVDAIENYVLTYDDKKGVIYYELSDPVASSLEATQTFPIGAIFSFTEEKNNGNSSTGQNNQDTPSTFSENNTSQTKSNNNYLRSLEIEGYTIDFNRDITEYELIVPKDTNQLKINVTLESDKATYDILGSDDLKGNNYVVGIPVKAENGDVKTYLIRIKTDEEVKESAEVPSEEDKELDKKYLYIGGGILVLLLLGGFISYLKNRKIDKALGDL